MKLILLLLSALAPMTTCFGQATDESQSSLDFVPANSSFYAASMRNREQFDVLVNSNAFKAVSQSPLVGMLVGQAQAMWDEQAEMKAELEKPENQELIQVLIDAASHEMFAYGGPDTLGVATLWGQIFEGAIQLGPDPDEQQQTRLMIDVLERNIDKLHVPQLVFGAKLTNVAAAESQMKRLDFLLEQAAGDERGSLTREEIAGGNYLVLRINGEFAWDEIDVPEDLDDESKAKVDRILEHANKTNFVVAFGIRGNYLLVSIGEDTEQLEKFGKQPLLAKTSRFKLLEPHLEERLVSVQYVSGELIRTARKVAGQTSFLNLMLLGLKQDDTIPPEAREKMQGMLETLMGEPNENVGPILGCAWMKPEGYEGILAEWDKQTSTNYSKPLSLLNRVSGSPIFVYANRLEDMKATYVWWRDLAASLGTMVEEAIESNPDQAENQEDFGKVVESIKPHVERLDRIMQEKVLPGLSDDGSFGIIVDRGKLTFPENSELAAQLPAQLDGVAVPRVSLMFGVSDQVKLALAGNDLMDLMMDVIKSSAEMSEQREKITPPRPAVSLTSSGVIVQFELEDARLNDEVSIGLSSDTLLIGHARELTESRLASKTTSLAMFGMESKPLGSVTYFDFREVVNMLEEWVSVGVEVMESVDPNAAGQVDAFAPQVKLVFDLMRCFEGTSSVTYKEDKGRGDTL